MLVREVKPIKVQALACRNFSGAWGRAPLAGSDLVRAEKLRSKRICQTTDPADLFVVADVELQIV